MRRIIFSISAMIFFKKRARKNWLWLYVVKGFPLQNLLQHITITNYFSKKKLCFFFLIAVSFFKKKMVICFKSKKWLYVVGCHRPPSLEPQELRSPGLEVAPLFKDLLPLNRGVLHWRDGVFLAPSKFPPLLMEFPPLPVGFLPFRLQLPMFPVKFSTSPAKVSLLES